MDITRFHGIELNLVLEKGKFGKAVPKYIYKALKNREILSGENEKIETSFVAPEAYVEYVGHKKDIYVKYAIKSDEDINSLTPADKIAMVDALEKLDVDYKDAISEVAELDKQKAEFVMETVDLPLLRFEESEIPEILQDNLIVNKWSEKDIMRVLSYVTNVKTEEITMTRKTAVELHTILSRAIFDRPFSNRFSLMSAYNMVHASDIVKYMAKEFAYPENESIYRAERVSIFAEYGINTDAEYLAMIDKKEELDKKIKELDVKYADLITKLLAIDEARVSAFAETITLNLVTVKLGEIPNISEDNQSINGWDDWSVMKVLNRVICDG
jgi:hypothetical protein